MVDQRSDTELLEALAAAEPGVEKGKALFDARYAALRRPVPGSAVDEGRAVLETRTKRPTS